MRAYELQSFDGPSGLRLADAPEPTANGEVVGDVHAIGINFPDPLATRGRYHHKPELPFIPGCEIARVVREAPADSGAQML